tara:strand:+ start:471 stop:626 length:156 start_codon:yes stop_codon:yes gene_type:complete
MIEFIFIILLALSLLVGVKALVILEQRRELNISLQEINKLKSDLIQKPRPL